MNKKIINIHFKSQLVVNYDDVDILLLKAEGFSDKFLHIIKNKTDSTNLKVVDGNDFKNQNLNLFGEDFRIEFWSINEVNIFVKNLMSELSPTNDSFLIHELDMFLLSNI